MAAIPAEPSRPSRRWRGAGAVGEDFLSSAVVITVFTLALYWFAWSVQFLARETTSDDGQSGIRLAITIVGLAIALALILWPLITYGAHPRTRSSIASASFAFMKLLMFIAGSILFVGGLLQSILSNENFVERVCLALTALFYVVTPLSLHATKR